MDMIRIKHALSNDRHPEKYNLINSFDESKDFG